MSNNEQLFNIYKTIAQQTNDHYLVCQSNGQIVFINQTMEQYLGVPSEDILGTAFTDIITINDQARITNHISNINAIPATTETFFFRNIDGINIPLSGQLFHKDGLIYFYGNENRQSHLDLQQKYKIEMKKASKIYQRSLPKNLPETDDIAFAAYYQPAEVLGGDFYNVFQVDNGMLNDFFEQYVVLLCDVSGHGLDSAMISLFAKETINQYFEHKHSEGQFLSPKEIVNDFIIEYLKEQYPEDYFICVFLGIFDIKNEEFVYCSAGYQNPPLMACQDGTLVELETGGLPISGALPKEIMNYPEYSVPLKNDTTFLISTDGMPEQMTSGEYYEERMKKLFLANTHRHPKDIVQILSKDFISFSPTTKITDDVTFIVGKIK
ncbi:SpoIIE family protein phosphatase [Desulfuribacillus alkaliarsenatis]|uniref:PAS domain-containing protein n=1 Tax=Desulfuribacillus alkaliarsenatis TaxID=766136 RepID=A0A1E5G2Z4_9FIRM|nr:SpoIIE family protein phosphatase [Desulfuribacillus alkaliarsenatis]OEF97423.1 hypothetical protein BHF68_04230 [Desulfuribacillus alkaliarsenatis]